MEELVDAGLVKSIGVSNFNEHLIRYILRMCRIPPAVNQVEVNMHFPNLKLIDYCHRKGIEVVGYAPFCSPVLLQSIGYIIQYYIFVMYWTKYLIPFCPHQNNSDTAYGGANGDENSQEVW